MKRSLVLAVFLTAMAAAQAQSVSDGFRQFVEKLRRGGERVGLVVPGTIGIAVREPYVMNRVDNLPLARQQVVVFVGANCRECFDAVDDVRRYATVPVEVMDVSSSGWARDAFAVTRATGLPATMAGSQILVGRQPIMLRAMIGAAGMESSNPVAN